MIKPGPALPLSFWGHRCYILRSSLLLQINVLPKDAISWVTAVLRRISTFLMTFLPKPQGSASDEQFFSDLYASQMNKKKPRIHCHVVRATWWVTVIYSILCFLAVRLNL